ncbi:glutamine--fructose-6-phosphate transaminase (isomerizing) [Sutterella sp. AM11-39]|jgi:glucosamine--fructose-6-phosphate aminotransferase (isomerizing)|uniref:glutamine--fructose-6-phosphate transaminase (isomerizing) n=1 Tax=Sutterella sp. AM11-39 TaxID=2292075 RepID=UPI000E471CAB|nr:glutamine--fructose-6-phosphate transaminase (isomerizing) [Sutterella sp. AM11-39]RHJ32848.1 glutamine--fructose-6-phosphate transaminase (isomerizing) [Sutterella sp. AM11-39]HJA17469.1 glutamine--fructose-6-phosphate transaminase (isomerizing) [Candidatus Duodenibacillus intestinigallinarum]
MCGIVAGVAGRDVVPVFLQGLKRLEYRGYDSCGVAVVRNGEIDRARSVARVKDLAEQVQAEGMQGTVGIAHTRWATHGGPVVANAHPHIAGNRIALVHNGIIENFAQLRAELEATGVTMQSQTDTEVLAHLVNFYLEDDLLEALKKALSRVTGAYAVAVFDKRHPERIVGARQGSPMVVGLGEGENFIASDAMALVGVTDKIVYLDDGDIVSMTKDTCEIFARTGSDTWQPVERKAVIVQAYAGAAELGPYRHYMQKEIFEQPRAIADTLEGVEGITPTLFGPEAETVFRDTRRILMLACGTSFYAALTSKYWLEAIAGIPVDVEIASEYRYRTTIPDPGTLVVTISQSGETADTLAALKHAVAMGMTKTLAICNVAQSALVHECRLAYITRAGVEIGVASTKAFTTQLVALYLLTLVFAKLSGRLDAEKEAQALSSLRHIPAAMAGCLALEPSIIAWAERFAGKEDALFLGRGVHYPIALEGALKLKEISYIHAEAYPAGELKHGPLALVDADMPVVTIAPNDELLEKLKSNMQEVRARGGELYVFADGDSVIEDTEGMHVIRLAENYGDLSPILHIVPLQLLAYHTALARGTDVDKPRNLAKSVTVE